MLQYFVQQLKSAYVLTTDDVIELVGDDVSFGCGTQEELTDFYTSKLGQKILFYLLWSDDKLKYQLVRSFENDIEMELKNAIFIDMSAATPIFK